MDIEQSCRLEPDFDIIRHVLLDQHGFRSLAKSIDDLEAKFTKVSLQGLFG